MYFNDINGNWNGWMEEGRPPVRFWKIALPVVLVGVLLAAMVIGLALKFEQPTERISIISNFMLICFVLLPITICSFIFYVILGVISFGLNMLHKGTQSQLVRVNTVTENLKEKATQTSASISEKSIGINSRLAFLDEYFVESETDEK